jgi:hypothetical protein
LGVQDLPEVSGIAVENLTVYGAVPEGLGQAILLSLGFGPSFGSALGLTTFSVGRRGGRGIRLGWGAHTA